MNDRDLRYIGISASWLSICIVGLALLNMAGSEANVGIILFILWCISPYLVLILGEFVVRKIAVIPKITKFFSLVSVLLLIFTIVSCIEVIKSKSSTTGLVFIFVPFYLNILVTFLIISGLIWAASSKSINK